MKLGDIATNCFDRPRHVTSQNLAFRFDQPRKYPYYERGASQKMPVKRIDGRRVHSDQHLVIRDGRLIDILEVKDIGRPVFLIDNRLHRDLL